MTTITAEQPSRRGVGTRADVVSRYVLGGGFLVVALLLAGSTESVTPQQWWALPAVMLVYGLAYRTVFRHAQSGSVPTEPALVAMLFVIPLTLVPLAVLIAQVIAGRELTRERGLLYTLTIAWLNGWHSVGPVVVLLIANPGPPSLANWPVYVVALAAQFVADLGTGLVREYALGRSLRSLVRPMLWSMLIDLTLAVIGLCIVIAAPNALTAVALVGVPIALVALLARDRQELSKSTVTLGQEVASAREEARVDAMTGLHNRRAWYESVDAAEQIMTTEAGWSAGVIVVDLDNLKVANDTFGHEVGDAMIAALAESVRAVLPAGATACRTGGDEFAILMVGPDAGQQIPVLADALHRQIREHPAVHGSPLSAGVGYGLCPPAGSVGDAMRLADSIVYADKRRRRVARTDVSLAAGPKQRRDEPRQVLRS